MNENIVNLIAFGYENLYDQKVKKAIDYFTQQREYYLAIFRIKVKYGLTGGAESPPNPSST